MYLLYENEIKSLKKLNDDLNQECKRLEHQVNELKKDKLSNIKEMERLENGKCLNQIINFISIYIKIIFRK